MLINYRSANVTWRDTVIQVLKHGKHTLVTCADGQVRDTLEITGQTLYVNMSQPVVTLTKRKIGYRFMAADAAWILSGSDKVADIAGYNQHVQKYSDDGIAFFGAYGPKIVGQLDYVCHTLLLDPSSRRAVLTIWRENPPTTKDTPCTLSAQFLIRDGYLDCVVTMRSSDTWIGLPYDIFTFSMIAGVVFLRLKLAGLELKGLGKLVNFAGSRHLYQQDIDRIKEIDFVENPGSEKDITKKDLFNVHNFNDPVELVGHLWAIANGDGKMLKCSFLSDLAHIHQEDARG